VYQTIKHQLGIIRLACVFENNMILVIIGESKLMNSIIKSTIE